MNNKKKYNPPDHQYSNFCRVEGCDLPLIKCHYKHEDGKVCNHYGHPNFWKYGDNGIIPVIEHAHFLPNIDIGRNVNHRAGNPRTCPESMKVYTWRLYQGFDRWNRIPKEQKEAMGWDI